VTIYRVEFEIHAGMRCASRTLGVGASSSPTGKESWVRWMNIGAEHAGRCTATGGEEGCWFAQSI